MSALFANNASSRSPIDIQSADVTLKTMPGEGAKFPTPGAGDFFMVTLEDRRTGQIEICRCTGRSGDQLNVVRAQEGTTAQKFFLGTTISNRITAGTVTAFAGVPEVPEVPAGKIYGRSYLAWLETITKATYDTHLVTQDTRDDAQDVRMDGLTSKNGQQDTRLDLIETMDADQNAAINANTVKNAEQDGRLTTVENKNTAQDGRLDAVEAKNATQDGRLDAGDAKDTAQDAAIAAVKQFPEAPNDGQAYGRKNLNWTDVTEEAPADGLGYMRKNGAWTPSTGGATTSDTPPPPPLQNGQLWWESDTGDLFLYYDDGNSAQWVQVNNTGDALAWVDYLPPASPAQGQLWWRTDNGHLYVRYDDGNSQQWVDTTANGAVDLTKYTLKTADARNRVVNGAMAISQENSNNAGSTSDYYAVDQWSHAFTGGMVASLQRGTNPTPKGSPYRLRMVVTTAKASLAASDYLLFFQRIEGLRVSDFQWGTVNAKPVILRFMFVGPAGTYAAVIRSGNVDLSYIKEFTISAAQANIATEQIILIPGPTTGTWVQTNALGLYLGIHVACGSTYHGTNGVWQAGDKRGTAAMSNGAATVSNAFELGDVGFYLDSDSTGLPPPWQTPDEAEELARCKRYWQRGVNIYSVEQYSPVSGTGMFAPVTYPGGEMRINPTVAFTNAAFVSCGTLTGNASIDAMRVNVVSTANAVIAYATFGFTLNARM